jgi:hypothetical protein
VRGVLLFFEGWDTIVMRCLSPYNVQTSQVLFSDMRGFGLVWGCFWICAFFVLPVRSCYMYIYYYNIYILHIGDFGFWGFVD